MAEHISPRDEAGQGAESVPKVEVPNALFEGCVFLATALFGGWFVVGSFGMRDSTSTFGAGTFPFFAGVALILVSVAQMLLSIMPREIRLVTEVERPVAVALAAVMVLIFPMAIDWLGYFPVAAVWTPVFAILAGLRTPLSVVLVTASVVALAWFGFVMLLGTPLP